MPSPWKKSRSSVASGGGGAGTLSRLVSALRSDRRGGSLPVQTGFPTSLADIVVKNRGRLKKPSRKKKPSADCGSDESSAASAPSLPASDGGTPSEIAADDRLHVSVVQNSYGSCDVGIRLPRPELTGIRKTSGFRIGFGLLLVKLMVLMFLTIERKKLVAGITVFALGLWLLDTLGVQVVGFLKPCSSAERNLNSVFRGIDLENRKRVSPIREVVSASRSDTSISSVRSSVEPIHPAEPIYLAQKKNVLPERKDLVRIATVCTDQDTSSSRNLKSQKLFKKFTLKKLGRKIDDKGKNELSSCSSKRRLSDSSIVEEEEEVQEIAEEGVQTSDQPLLSFTASARIADFDIENIEVNQENIRKTKSISSQQLVYFALILLGLLGGKSVALILIVTWFLFCKQVESAWKKRVD